MKSTKRRSKKVEKGGIKILTGYHENLDRLDNKDVVNVESRMTIVKGEEAVDR